MNQTYSIYCTKPDAEVAVQCDDPRLQHLNIISSTTVRTDLLHETLAIQACDASKLHKMHIPKFDSKIKQWTRWQRNFEVDMQNAGVPRLSWMVIISRYMDDPSYKAYEHWTMRKIGCQTISWDELAKLFEVPRKEIAGDFASRVVMIDFHQGQRRFFRICNRFLQP